MNLFEIKKNAVIKEINTWPKDVEIIEKVAKLQCGLHESISMLETTDMKIQNVIKSIDNHFLGYLKNKPPEIKKLRVLEVYRYLYRFSFVRS